jgi:hypothetical protein
MGRSLKLRFESVTGDSRCPADAICITGGDAIVRLSATGDGGSLALELHTGDSSRASVTYGNVKVTLSSCSRIPSAAARSSRRLSAHAER